MHRGKRVVWGVIWRKNKKKEGGRENTKSRNASGVWRKNLPYDFTEDALFRRQRQKEKISPQYRVLEWNLQRMKEKHRNRPDETTL